MTSNSATSTDARALPHEELRPITQTNPCGPNLEYDPDYALLRARVAPRSDAQYGQFIESPESPDWAEIERDCRRLLLRTKDIGLLIWLCRARTRLHQAEGFAQGLDSIARALQTWPSELHPKLVIDGEEDHAVRANALASLADPEGLLGDLRDVVISSRTAARLTVRDVERAFATPRAAGAPSRDPITRQLAAMHQATNPEASPAGPLARSARTLQSLDMACKAQLGEAAPSFQQLQELLDLFMPATSKVEPPPSTHEASPSNLHPNPGTSSFNVISSRADTKESIRIAREWFEHNEPSSPVSVLLKQAERLVGKRFSEVVSTVPADLLKRWDDDDELSAT